MTIHGEYEALHMVLVVVSTTDWYIQLFLAFSKRIAIADVS